jgi:hypothetical protein
MKNGDQGEASKLSDKGNLLRNSQKFITVPSKMMRVNSTNNFKAREDIFQKEILKRKSSLEDKIENESFYNEKSLYFIK